MSNWQIAAVAIAAVVVLAYAMVARVASGLPWPWRCDDGYLHWRWCYGHDEFEFDDDPAENLADEAVRRFWSSGVWAWGPGATEPIGEYDDGEPVTGELAAVDDELSLEHTGQRRLYLDLSDDPDLIQWDARQQAARTWEIAHIGFPELRAQIAREYAAAAAECRDYYGRRLAA